MINVKDHKILSGIQFTKLDGRHTGHHLFKWYLKLDNPNRPDYIRFNNTMHSAQTRIDTRINRIVDFTVLRQWCWETWGPSCDHKDYMEMHYHTPLGIEADLNQHWCWSNDERQKEFRIYLVSDEEKLWTELRWN